MCESIMRLRLALLLSPNSLRKSSQSWVAVYSNRPTRQLTTLGACRHMLFPQPCLVPHPMACPCCRYGHSYTIELRVRPEAGLLDSTEADLVDLSTPLDVAVGGPEGASALDATSRCGVPACHCVHGEWCMLLCASLPLCAQQQGEWCMVCTCASRVVNGQLHSQIVPCVRLCVDMICGVISVGQPTGWNGVAHK